MDKYRVASNPSDDRPANRFASSHNHEIIDLTNSDEETESQAPRNGGQAVRWEPESKSSLNVAPAAYHTLGQLAHSPHPPLGPYPAPQRGLTEYNAWNPTAGSHATSRSPAPIHRVSNVATLGCSSHFQSSAHYTPSNSMPAYSPSSPSKDPVYGPWQLPQDTELPSTEAAIKCGHTGLTASSCAHAAPLVPSSGQTSSQLAAETTRPRTVRGTSQPFPPSSRSHQAGAGGEGAPTPALANSTVIPNQSAHHTTMIHANPNALNAAFVRVKITSNGADLFVPLRNVRTSQTIMENLRPAPPGTHARVFLFQDDSFLDQHLLRCYLLWACPNRTDQPDWWFRYAVAGNYSETAAQTSPWAMPAALWFLGRRLGDVRFRNLVLRQTVAWVNRKPRGKVAFGFIASTARAVLEASGYDDLTAEQCPLLQCAITLYLRKATDQSLDIAVNRIHPGAARALLQGMLEFVVLPESKEKTKMTEEELEGFKEPENVQFNSRPFG